MWYALRRNVQAKYGKTLHITPGMNGYRDWAEQGVGRRNACAQGNCNAAAAQGYSSHGGTWRSSKYTGGRWVDAMAFDIGDYWQIGQAAFYAEARAVGFQAGLITPEIAGIFEPWHLIVFDPWGVIPASLDVTDFQEDDVLNEDDKKWISDWFGSLRDGYLRVPGLSYGFPQATLSEIRAAVTPRLDGIVARQDATNTWLPAIVEMIKELDPSKEADIAAFEGIVRESEARTLVAVAKTVEDSTAALRAELVAALSGATDAEVVTAAVDEAFGRVFANYVPAG